MASVWSSEKNGRTGIGRSSQRRRGRSNRVSSFFSRRMGVVGRIWRGLDSITRWRALTALPLGLYIFLGSVYFLALMQSLSDVNSLTLFWTPGTVPENEAEKLSAELLKQKVQVLGYLLTTFMLAFRIREAVKFFTREKTLVFVIGAILLSALGSDYPERVVIALAHLTFGIAATWLYFADARRQTNVVYYACMITLVPLMITLGGSLLIFMMHDSGSVTSLLEGQRTGVLGGNPNSLGGVCMSAAWATFGLMSITRLNSRRMMWLMLALFVVLFNVWATGSASTLLVVSGCAFMMLFFRSYNSIGKKTRAGLILGGTAVFFGVLMFLAVQQSADDYALAATQAVGKDLTLTGRTDLWFIAWDAFLQRPIFGWGYDNHQTVFEHPLYAVPYNHYHNGFLDSLVSGGFLFAAAIIISYAAFIRRYFAINTVVKGSYVFIVAAAAASLQNMTEYSLWRNGTAVFHIYIISLVAMTVVTERIKKAKRTRPSRRSSQSQRSAARQLHW